MSFRTKTILGIAAIEFVLLSIIVWTSITVLQHAIEREAYKRADTVANLFAATASDAVLTKNLSALHSVVNEVLNSPDLRYARVFDLHQQRLAEGGDPELLTRVFVPDASFSGIDDGVLDIGYDLNVAGVHYGRVELGIDVAAIKGLLTGERHRLLFLAAIEILLTGLFSFVLGHVLTRQLRTLSDGTRRLVEGGLGYQVPVHGKDELAETALAFNSMSRDLLRAHRRQEKVEQDLRTLADELEDRVQLRTQQLAALNRELQHRSLHDPLTKLPNRMLFRDRLEQALASARREDTLVGLLIIDLDGFKEVNDTAGHHTGDALLQQTANRLRDAVRGVDTVARLGGDEFAVILHTVDDLEHACEKARELNEVIRQPVEVGGERHRVGASIGVALYPEHADTETDLLCHADAAMYSAKRQRAGVLPFEGSHQSLHPDRQSLKTDLRQALNDHQFVLHYQPKVDFQSDSVSGVEALVRWQHPTRGLLMPLEFLPLAEDANLMKPLTAYVLRGVLAQCHEWVQRGLEVPITVNISDENIQDVEFPAQVRRILDEFDVPRQLIDMGVTEAGLIVDPARASDNIRKLRDLGVTITIDNFGTGYSCMSYLNLQHHLVDKIRLDRSFILDMMQNENDAAVVRANIDIAHTLGLKVIASGVENEQLWDELKTFGCDGALGYYRSRPLPPEEFIAWMQSLQQKQAVTSVA